MHQVFDQIAGVLETIVDKLGELGLKAEPLGMQLGNGTFPAVSISELQQQVGEIIASIDARAPEEVGDSLPLLSHYVLRLQFLINSTLPNIPSNAGAATWAFSRTLEGLELALKDALVPTPPQEIERSIQDSTRRARAIASNLAELTERSTNLDQMVTRIESAHVASEELPTDLQSLKEARGQIETLMRGATLDRDHVAEARASVESANGELVRLTESAKDVLARCETAYASATSTGLAAAFSERSKALHSSVGWWVAGLVAALTAGSLFTFNRTERIAGLLAQPGDHGLLLGVNLVLAILSVGGSVWFAWLSTKQIGQRFRLSEDYAFKASISRAYEGYRREASHVDPELVRQLLGSALSRLDEQPLRLVESDSFGSPWHEMLSSESIKDAAKMVPGFAEQVTNLAKTSLDKVRLQKKSADASKGQVIQKTEQLED